MKLPDWLPKLTRHDELLRAANGLCPKRDGWYKSVDGKTRYICKPCPVKTAAGLLGKRLVEIRDKEAGVDRVRRVRPGRLTLDGLAEAYGAWLWQRLTTGIPRKLSRRTYDDAIAVIDRFVDVAGPDRPASEIGPDDFTRYAQNRFVKRAASSVRREIIYIEAWARWASPGIRRAGLLDHPWNFGPDFEKPSDSAIAHGAAETDKSYSPDQLRSAFRAVRRSAIYRAAGLLGLNCGFLARDVATLPISAVDLQSGVIRFARGKTGVARLCVLWPWTVRAMRKYLGVRPNTTNPEASGLFFATANGLPYSRSSADGMDPGRQYDGIGNRWHKLTGLPFSGLRSTFATAADDWSDQRAVDLVLGHRSHESIRSRHYAKRFEITRIENLAWHVWPRVLGRKSPMSERILRARANSPASPAPDVAPKTPHTQPAQSDTSAGSTPVAEHPTP